MPKGFVEKGEMGVVTTQPGETAEGRCDSSRVLSKSTLRVGGEKQGQALRKKLYEVRNLELEIIVAH